MKRLVLVPVLLAAVCVGCQPASSAAPASAGERKRVEVNAPGVNVEVDKKKDGDVNVEVDRKTKP